MALISALSKSFSRSRCKRPRISKIDAQRRQKKSSSKVNISKILERRANETEFLYGLKPVDFTVVPPIYRSPPPPPPRAGMQKYLFPISTVAFAGITAYFYFNNKNDSFTYWEAMQTGGVLPGTYDDDDDDDDDFDDEDE